MTDPIRDGIQKFLDEDDGGWQIRDFIVCMGLERIRNGEVETCSWQYVPPSQPNYTTMGLLDTGADCVVYDDEDL